MTFVFLPQRRRLMTKVGVRPKLSHMSHDPLLAAYLDLIPLSSLLQTTTAIFITVSASAVSKSSLPPVGNAS